MSNSPESLLTIGELARRGNVSTSLLRYYEKEQLLVPSGRTEAGYRLYSRDAERTLRFIRSAQRYGFSLHDIGLIIGSDKQDKHAINLVALAEERFLDIERRLTEMLVQRHELELFLDDLNMHVEHREHAATEACYRDLLEQACDHQHSGGRKTSLDKLVRRLHCNLVSTDWENVFADLRGQHSHMWREEEGYSIQFPSREPAVKAALERIAAGESDCEAHNQPEVIGGEQGPIFIARGDNAFLYAQLFMALETAEA